jgi:hypothetical protein
MGPVIWVEPLVVNAYVPAGRATKAFDPGGGATPPPELPDDFFPPEVAPGDRDAPVPGEGLPDEPAAGDTVGEEVPPACGLSFFELHPTNTTITTNAIAMMASERALLIRTSTPR